MLKHPKALPYLFLTEMWERFGYYLMIGIFVLYMTDPEGGMGFTRAMSADVFGTFIALAYLTPFVGGLLADRLLGFRASIIAGGILMGLGYLLLSVPHNQTTFYAALFIMVLGNGFFKPNISILLGNLYNEDRYRDKKDDGFSIFYMGINLGALICNFVAAYLRNNYSWGHAFAAAGIGMFIGVGVFILGLKHYKHADVRKEAAPGEGGVGTLLSSVLLPALITGVLAWNIPGNIFGSDSTDAFLFGAMPVVGFYLWILRKAAIEEKPRIRALLAVYGVVIVFWAVFKQNGTALTTWAEFYTDRSMAPALETVAKSLGATQQVTNEEGTHLIYDSQFRTHPGPDGKPAKGTTLEHYLLNMPDSESPAPGTTIKVVSTEIFQSVNPLFVLLLTPLVIMTFTWLRKRKKEPTTPGKIGWGLVISALSTLVTIGAVYACHNGAEKASAWWIIGTYGVITIGELCLSPMGLSMVSKTAPARLAGLMMGGWQLATSLGNKLSGVLAKLWDNYEDKSHFFMVNFVMLSVAALTLFLMLRWLNKIFKDAGVH